MVQKILRTSWKFLHSLGYSKITCENALSNLKFDRCLLCCLCGFIANKSYFLKKWHSLNFLKGFLQIFIICFLLFFKFVDNLPNFFLSLQRPCKIIRVLTVLKCIQPVSFLVWFCFKESLIPHALREQSFYCYGLVDLILKLFTSRPPNTYFEGLVLSQAFDFCNARRPIYE